MAAGLGPTSDSVLLQIRREAFHPVDPRPGHPRRTRRNSQQYLLRFNLAGCVQFPQPSSSTFRVAGLTEFCCRSVRFWTTWVLWWFPPFVLTDPYPELLRGTGQNCPTSCITTGPSSSLRQRGTALRCRSGRCFDSAPRARRRRPSRRCPGRPPASDHPWRRSRSSAFSSRPTSRTDTATIRRRRHPHRRTYREPRQTARTIDPRATLTLRLPFLLVF